MDDPDTEEPENRSPMPSNSGHNKTKMTSPEGSTQSADDDSAGADGIAPPVSHPPSSSQTKRLTDRTERSDTNVMTKKKSSSRSAKEKEEPLVAHASADLMPTPLAFHALEDDDYRGQEPTAIALMSDEEAQLGSLEKENAHIDGLIRKSSSTNSRKSSKDKIVLLPPSPVVDDYNSDDFMDVEKVMADHSSSLAAAAAAAAANPTRIMHNHINDFFQDETNDEQHQLTDDKRSEDIKQSDDAGYELHDDVYSMMFLAQPCSSTFIFSMMVFILKIIFFSFISWELSVSVDISGTDTGETSGPVRTCQFLMIPVAIAIQEDLIASFALIANISYDANIMRVCPGATRCKWFFASACRFTDGMFSLSINFILLLQATAILPLFLNFAALQFLQTIDNVAFNLALNGYLSEGIEEIAKQATVLKLPRNHSKSMNKLDSGLFLATYLVMLIAWSIITAQNLL